MGRTLAACALPALACRVAWLRIEDPRLIGEGLAVAALALAPGAPSRRAWQRRSSAVVAAAGAAQVAFGAQRVGAAPVPRRAGARADRRSRSARRRRLLRASCCRFEPGRHPEMHALVLAAIFGFVLVTSLLVAARRPVARLPSTSQAPAGRRRCSATTPSPSARWRSRRRCRSRSSSACAPCASLARGSCAGRARRRRCRLGVVRDDGRPRGGARLGELGHPRRRPAAGHRRSVRVGLELRRDRVPAGRRRSCSRSTAPSAHATGATSTLDLFTDDHWFEDLALALPDRG